MLRFVWLLAMLIAATLAFSCSHGSSTQKVQPSAEVAGAPLPMSQDGAIPVVPDPIEIYVVKADGGDPKLVTVLPGTAMWDWSGDDA
jgi:hypothetical protein